MISFFNVLMTVVFITVVAAAIGYGGRYERALAIVLVVSGVVGKGAQRLLDDYLPLGVFAVIDVAILASMFWLLWRVRPTWLLLMAGAQTSVLGLVAAPARLDTTPAAS